MFSYKPPSFQQTELGKLRVVMADIKGQALGKKAFAKGQTMAEGGDSHYR